MLNNIKSKINHQDNIYLSKKERDPYYQKFKKCLSVRFKDCIDSNEFERTYQNQMCKNEVTSICMTKFPYDISIDDDYIKQNNLSPPITPKLTTYEQIIENPLTKTQIINDISNKSVNEAFNLKEDEEDEKNISESIVFLWYYIIEPNIKKIITAIILIILLVQAKNHNLI